MAHHKSPSLTPSPISYDCICIISLVKIEKYDRGEREGKNAIAKKQQTKIFLKKKKKSKTSKRLFTLSSVLSPLS
jgi:uncharacterized protein (UPF0262 family)